MLMGRHNTHVLSSFNSSLNNNSYNSDFKDKINNLKNPNKDKNNSINAQLTKLQLSKINDILSKYNLVSDRNQKIDSTLINNKNPENENNKMKSNTKGKKSTKSLNSEDKSIQKKSKKKIIRMRNNEERHVRNNNNNNNILNLNLNNNNSITNQSDNIFSSNYKEKSDENKKDDYLIGKYKEYKDNNTKSESKNNDPIYAMSYKSSTRETRFNNVEKNIEKEIKIQQKMLKEKKNILLLYKQNINPRNLIRSINKPEISFITKINKKSSNYYFRNNDFSDIRLNIKNNLCFLTKKIVRQDEFVVMEKQIKKEKFRKLKKEIEEEKIPTFSSINTSSTNSPKKITAKRKSKTKSKSIKKNNKVKQKIKPNNIIKKKKSLLPKNKLRAISIQSKISNEKSEDRKTITSRKNAFQKIPNIKKKERIHKLEKKPVNNNKNSNKDNRKFSIASRLQDRFLKKNKNVDINKMSSNNSVRNLNQFNSPFKNNNSLFNINKETEGENNKINNSATKDKDKQNNELDFKKFLEEQKIKRSNQIRNFMKRQGMNSYNFFYPKEPSPLLGIFKNKCSVYPTLNINRKSIEDKKGRKLMKKRNDDFYIQPIQKKGNKSYRKEGVYLKNIFKEKEHKEKENNNLHLIEKHYGNENDCPLCRTFKFKNDDEIGSNYAKTTKYNKLKFVEKNSGMFSPNSQSNINLNKIGDLNLMSRNRINSSKLNDFINKNESFIIKRNFNVLFDYFLQ